MAALKRKKVVLIGSPQGYVKNLISDLLKMECRVALLSPRFESAHVLPDLPEDCRGFLWCPVDIEREDSLISALRRVQEQWGPIDVAFNTVVESNGFSIPATLRVLSVLTLSPRFQIPKVVQINSPSLPDKVLNPEEWEGLNNLKKEVETLQRQYEERRYPVQLTSISLPILERSQYPVHQITTSFYEQVRPTQLAKAVVHSLEEGQTRVVLGSRTMSRVEGLDLASELLDRALSHAETGIVEASSDSIWKQTTHRLSPVPVWLGVCAFLLSVWLLKEE